MLGQSGDEEPAGPALGFPVFATKNTTRVGGADPVADAAAVAQAVFPSRSEDTRPAAVVLVDQDDWRAGIAASQLAAAPVRAPVLFTEGDQLPEASADALDKLQPTGARQAGNAQVIRIGDVAEARRPEVHRRPRGQPGRHRRGDRQAAVRRRAQAQQGGRGRLRRPARLRDARRRLGRQVRRPGAVDGQGRAAAGDQGGDPGPQEAEDLPAGARGRHLRGRRGRAAQARRRRADLRPRPGHERDRVRALQRRRLRLGRQGPGPRLRVRVHPPDARRRRRRAAVGGRASTARCCSSRRPRRCPSRCRTTCSTSSRATTRTRFAGSTITAG